MSKQKVEKINNKKSVFLKWIIILITLIIAASLIIVSIVLLNKNEYPYSKDPIAKISLDNGMELYFELYDDKVPLAVGNFVYRANNGYYKETIIHNYKKTNINDGLYLESGKNYNKDMPLSEKHRLKEDMKYTVKKDINADDKLLTQKYYIASVATSSTQYAGSEFRICLKESSSTNETVKIFGVAFGYPYDQKTIDNLDMLFNQITEQALKIGDNIPSQHIKITGVKILTVKDYWKNFDYTKEWSEGDYKKA